MLVHLELLTTLANVLGAASGGGLLADVERNADILGTATRDLDLSAISSSAARSRDRSQSLVWSGGLGILTSHLPFRGGTSFRALGGSTFIDLPNGLFAEYLTARCPGPPRQSHVAGQLERVCPFIKQESHKRGSSQSSEICSPSHAKLSQATLSNPKALLTVSRSTLPVFAYCSVYLTSASLTCN